MPTKIICRYGNNSSKKQWVIYLLAMINWKIHRRRHIISLELCISTSPFLFDNKVAIFIVFLCRFTQWHFNEIFVRKNLKLCWSVCLHENNETHEWLFFFSYCRFVFSEFEGSSELNSHEYFLYQPIMGNEMVQLILMTGRHAVGKVEQKIFTEEALQ